MMFLIQIDIFISRCALPNEQDIAYFTPLSPNASSLSYPWDSVQKSYSSCVRYDANFTPEYYAGGQSANNTVPCDRWLFDPEWNTTVSEWSLVCDKAWYRGTSDAFLMMGVLLGSLIFGDISDRFGRKPTFMISILIMDVFGTLAAFAPDFWTFTACRLIVGASTSGVFLVAYVLALEMVGPSKRIIAGTVIHMFFSIGFLLIAGLAYFVHDWRHLDILVTLPGLIYLAYWWFIPESARWLISKGRNEEAKLIIQAVAEENKVILEGFVLDGLLAPSPEEEEKLKAQNDGPKPSIFELFRHPNLFKKSVIIFFLWFVCSLTYYGLSWNTANLGGNIYLNFIISGMVEIPAYLSSMLTLDRYGRKNFLCPCLILSGLCLIVSALLPLDLNTVSIVLAMMGKFFITGAYGAVYIFSAEQFPTVIRNIGIGAGSTFARVGGIFASYTSVLVEIWLPLPFLMFGVLSLTAGILSLILPETHHKKLPESIADGENFGKKSSKS
ncbi:organic cation transporter protein-like [Diaphorina citri]|uniref:Organic cation transporter protein-like n=1 Tax=Diaphorina citri TaxID=121845 RepID=A0A3Q0ITL4_DIACI|nr:organic cation transporter protein-like [Diaphorina citri]